jgi:hypothetical protein
MELNRIDVEDLWIQTERYSGQEEGSVGLGSRLLSNTRPALNPIHAMFSAIVTIILFRLSAAIE